MNKKQFKLYLFSYIFRNLVDMHMKRNRCDEKQAISSFSTKRAMRLLYFICLNSATEKDSGLFRYFDSFCAYMRGPVEIDIYQAYDIIPGLIYENEHYTDINPVDFNMIDTAILVETDIAINKLMMFPLEIFNSEEKLSDLTHKTELWEFAYLYKANYRMNIDDLNSIHRSRESVFLYILK